MNEHHVQWLILTALGLEYNAVRERLSDCKSIVHPHGTRYEVGRANGVSIAIAECGAGNTGAALECERAIGFFKPKFVLFVGVAGGVKDVALGDVVFASKVYGYESGKAELAFQPRPNVFVTDYGLLQSARQIARTSSGEGRATVGPIAAGEKVIASMKASEFHFIKRNYGDAVAVEMEGYGFLHAGYANSIPCMVVRGISDLIDGKARADAGGSQPRAARNAAELAINLIHLHKDQSPEIEISREALAVIAEKLYPLGPCDNQLWSRAGGDIALLQLNQTGRAAWFSALKVLYAGGGGQSITPQTLLTKMIEDHPNNNGLLALLPAGRTH